MRGSVVCARAWVWSGSEVWGWSSAWRRAEGRGVKRARRGRVAGGGGVWGCWGGSDGKGRQRWRVCGGVA